MILPLDDLRSESDGKTLRDDGIKAKRPDVGVGVLFLPEKGR